MIGWIRNLKLRFEVEHVKVAKLPDQKGHIMVRFKKILSHEPLKLQS